MSIFSRNKKTAAPAPAPQAHEHANEHVHSNDHAGDATAPVVRRPESVTGAVGIGATQFLVRPLITEKATAAQSHNTYLFVVQPRASKRAVKEAVEKVYSVRVTNVRTCRYDGKRVGSGRSAGARSAWKKAFVTVAKGQTISFA